MYQRRPGPARSRQPTPEAPSSPRDKGHWMAVGDLFVRVASPAALPLPTRTAPEPGIAAAAAFRTGLEQGKEAGRRRGRADARHISGTWLSHHLVAKNVMVYAAADHDRLGQAAHPWRRRTENTERQAYDERAQLLRPDSPETVVAIVALGARVRRGRAEPAAVHAEAYRLGAVGAYRAAWLDTLAAAVLRSALGGTALVADGVRDSAMRKALGACARANASDPSGRADPPGSGLRPVADLRGAAGQGAGTARTRPGTQLPGIDRQMTERPGRPRAGGARGPLPRHGATPER